MNPAPVSTRFRRTETHPCGATGRGPALGTRLSATQLRGRLAARLREPSRQFFRIGRVSLIGRTLARAELLDPANRLLVSLEVDRFNGRVLRHD